MAEIAKMKMDFVRDYVDKGQSGADDSRPGWKALLADARLGKFDAVYVFDLDRFTRDMLHGLTATRELRALGITLHDAKDPAADAASVDAQLMTGFRLLIAEEERRKIKERTVRGQRAKLDSGEWPGGKPCFGWKLEGIRTRNAHPIPNQDERKVLDQIFTWLVREGKSTSEICELLNANGIKSRTGIRWGHAVLRRIISNPTLHTGWFVWGSPDEGSEDSRSHKTKVDREGNPIYGLPKKIYLPNPPFTKVQFLAVQRALKAHPRAGNLQKPSVSRVLTGRIYGSCGRHYTGTSITGKDYDLYRCTGNRHRGNEVDTSRCGCSQINAQKIENRVWVEVGNLISSPEKLTALASDWMRQTGVDEDATESELDRIDSAEAKLLRALSMVQDDYYFAEGKSQAQLRVRIDRYKADLAALNARKLVLIEYKNDVGLQNKQLRTLEQIAKRAKDRIASLGDNEKREIYELLRVRIVISDVNNSEPRTLCIFGQVDERIAVAPQMGGADSGLHELPEMPFKVELSS